MGGFYLLAWMILQHMDMALVCARIPSCSLPLFLTAWKSEWVRYGTLRKVWSKMISTFPFHHFFILFKITFRLFDMLCIQCIMLLFLFELHSSTGSFTAHQPIEHSSLSPDSKASSVPSTHCCSLWRRSLVCFISIPWQQKGPRLMNWGAETGGKKSP